MRRLVAFFVSEWKNVRKAVFVYDNVEIEVETSHGCILRQCPRHKILRRIVAGMIAALK
jgi:hypothetical protein